MKKEYIALLMVVVVGVVLYFEYKPVRKEAIDDTQKKSKFIKAKLNNSLYESTNYDVSKDSSLIIVYADKIEYRIGRDLTPFDKEQIFWLYLKRNDDDSVHIKVNFSLLYKADSTVKSKIKFKIADSIVEWIPQESVNLSAELYGLTVFENWLHPIPDSLPCTVTIEVTNVGEIAPYIKFDALTAKIE